MNFFSYVCRFWPSTHRNTHTHTRSGTHTCTIIGRLISSPSVKFSLMPPESTFTKRAESTLACVGGLRDGRQIKGGNGGPGKAASVWRLHWALMACVTNQKSQWQACNRAGADHVNPVERLWNRTTLPGHWCVCQFVCLHLVCVCGSHRWRRVTEWDGRAWKFLHFFRDSFIYLPCSVLLFFPDRKNKQN